MMPTFLTQEMGGCCIMEGEISVECTAKDLKIENMDFLRGIVSNSVIPCWMQGRYWRMEDNRIKLAKMDERRARV